jgi:Exostosin family
MSRPRPQQPGTPPQRRGGRRAPSIPCMTPLKRQLPAPAPLQRRCGGAPARCKTHPPIAAFAALAAVALLLIVLAPQPSLTPGFSSPARARSQSTHAVLSPLQRASRLRPLTHADAVRTARLYSSAPYARARLRVFVYELPGFFNDDVVARSRTLPAQLRDPDCATNFYSADVALAEFLRAGGGGKDGEGVRTRDPAEADLFFVPVYTTCYLITHLPNNVTKTGRFFVEARDMIMKDLPYWNRSWGTDHVFAFTQGFGARLSGDWRAVANATFLVHNGDRSEAHFRPGRDIVFPPNLESYLVPVAVLEEEQRSRMNTSEIARKDIADYSLGRVRDHFAFFGGQVVSQTVSDDRGSNHSGGVRQYFMREIAALPGYHMSSRIRVAGYVSEMAASTFCLCPEGWHAWSPRPYYAVLVDCIPVVVSTRSELALGGLVDWSRIAIFVDPKDVRTLDATLKAIGRDEIRKRREEMRAVWPLLHYGGRGNGLAIEAVLHELWLRSLKVSFAEDMRI